MGADIAAVKGVLQGQLVDVDIADGKGCTLLYTAADNPLRMPHWEVLPVIRLLLKNRADPKRANASGGTPAHVAAGTQDTDSSLIELLKARADVEAKNKHGHTPLIAAAWGGKHVNVARLIQARAELNIKDNYGKTALVYAKEKQFDRVVDLLLQEGAANPA